MIRRWRRTCYRHAHAENLAARSKAMEEVKPVVPDLTEFDALFNPVKAVQKSASESGKPASKALVDVAGSVVSAATTLESTFSVSRRLETRTNTAKSASRAGGTELSLPSIPRCEKLGSEYIYDCLYCGRLPVTHTPLSSRSWK